MPTPEVAVPVEVLREAARARAEELGLRDAAAEIGLSFSGLRTFLGGTTPHPRTIQKLWIWHSVRTVTDIGRAQNALMFLLGHLPADHRRALAREITRRIEHESREAEVAIPSWLASGVDLP